MKLSTKGRYAVTAMADLALAAQEAQARNAEADYVSLADISERQQISVAYLEQIFARLRRAGLVESVRGPGGGYRLARAAADTRVSDIMSAVDEALNAAKCGDASASSGCGGSREACLTHDLWEQLSAHVHVFLHGVSLADVVGRRLTPCYAFPTFSALLEEDGGAASGRRAET